MIIDKRSKYSKDKSKVMDKAIGEDDCEYNRLGSEQLMRIDKIYSDGAVVTSILLLYFAACLQGVYSAYSALTDLNKLLMLPICCVSFILFFIPILLCHSFALKTQENLEAIIGLSCFFKTYFEKPDFTDGEVRGKKWETLHKNTMFPAIKYEIKEYYYLAILALVAIFACVFVEVFFMITYKGENNSIDVMIWCILAIKFLAIAFPISIVLKISQCVNVKTVFAKVLSANLFYQEQKQRLLESNNSEEISNVISSMNKRDFAFKIFLLKKRIPYYKATELEKMFYNKEFNHKDKLCKKFKNIADNEKKDFYNYVISQTVETIDGFNT